MFFKNLAYLSIIGIKLGKIFYYIDEYRVKRKTKSTKSYHQ